MTKKYRQAGLILGCALWLQACASASVETVDVQEPKPQKYYDLMGDGFGGGTRAGGVDPLIMAGQSSDPSVQVFSLDGVPVPSLRSEATRQLGRSVYGSYSSDSGVEVFPLDGGGGAVLPTIQSHAIERMNLPHAPHVTPMLSEYSHAQESRDTVLSPLNGPDTPHYVTIETPGEPLVRIYFDHDSVQISPSHMDKIMHVTTRFNPNRDDTLLSVEGHASVESSEGDPIKRRMINMRVSMDRAYNVAKALMEAGIPAERIRTVSWGEGKPSLAQDASNPLESSRRVEVFQLR